MNYDLQSKILSTGFMWILIIGFAYAGWKVYKSDKYKRAIQKEFDFSSPSLIVEFLIKGGMWAVWTVMYSVVTVVIPLIIFSVIWVLVFGWF